MKPFSILLSVLLFLLVKPSHACTLRDARNMVDYRFNLPDDQCRKILYIDGVIIPFRLSYPKGEVVDTAWKGEVVNVRLHYVSERYDFNALIDSEVYLRSEQGVDAYRLLNEDNYIFHGRDGARVVVRKRSRTWLAHRMQRGVLVISQYPRHLVNIKEIDEFVRIFVEQLFDGKDL